MSLRFPDSTKNVLQMSINGDEPPRAYVVEGSAVGGVGEIPIIDVGVFLPSSSPEPEVLDSELGKLRSALAKEGCFQAIGHGISSSFLDKIREIAKEFFGLPEEEKQKYCPSNEDNEFQGYGNDVVVSENQVLDWNYRIFIQVFPHDSRKLNLWPNGFREILEEYVDNIKLVMEALYKAIAKSLKIDEDSFVKQLGDLSPMNARFNFYPPCSRPDLVLGVKAHTDGSALTILLQDKEMEGLQVFVDDKWVKVPALPYALIVNLGDQMEIMSNGILKSPLHRAVTNSERMRISLAMFHIPEIEREIGPVEGLVDEERPKKYKSIKNYGAINYECYQKGIVPIDTLKI
ncbi:codeine O-demethylase-like isoform X2 [Benincasa hispida]|uniref:codeine O-demethylase-like isoform X2 n=1 Tax=Benincasa hispida TaxID=102211 RepID=UPI001900AFCC|nr:codeine O-demethylase-like isoform X2 [Benincasa hispida]